MLLSGGPGTVHVCVCVSFLLLREYYTTTTTSNQPRTGLQTFAHFTTRGLVVGDYEMRLARKAGLIACDRLRVYIRQSEENPRPLFTRFLRHTGS